RRGMGARERATGPAGRVRPASRARPPVVRLRRARPDRAPADVPRPHPAQVPMNTAFPPQARLVRVVTALTADVSTRWSTVLADPRWAEVATSIDRLSVPGVAAGL